MTLDINTVCLSLMGITLVGGIANRLLTRKGIGWRFCQFLAIGMGLPAVIMLAFAKELDNDVVSAIVGAVVGAVIAHVGKDE